MKRYLLGLCLIIALVGIPANKAIGDDAATPVTYQEPLVYIGWDGNIWVTDIHSGAGTRITNDGEPFSFERHHDQEGTKEPQNLYRYSDIQWSPTDSTFSVVVKNASTDDFEFVSIFESGKVPSRFDIYRDSWSVNGEGFIYTNICIEEMLPGNGKLSIYESSINTKREKLLYQTDCLAWIIPEGQFEDHQFWLFNELPTRALPDYHYVLETTAYGYLFTGIFRINTPVKMLNPIGGVLWSKDIGSIAYDPRMTTAYTFDTCYENRCTPALVDLATGAQTELPTIKWHSGGELSGASALTPNKQYLVYNTVTIFDYPPTAYSDIKLWKLPVNGGVRQLLFQHPGTGIGTILPTKDNKGAIISLVTSTALFGTKDRPSLAEGRTHIELIYVDLTTGIARFIALGGQPALGNKPFTAIPANP